MANISNEFNMVKILQEVGYNFFPADVSEQRIGMFGFTIEALARLFGASVLDANMRANEYHTITAKKIDTLLNDAAILGVDVANTTPSEMTAYLAFKVDEIHRTEFYNPNEGTTQNHTYYFVIERDTNINIAGYNFMLEWDILVIAKFNNNKYVYSARYLNEGDTCMHDNGMCDGINHPYIHEDTLDELKERYIQGNLISTSDGDIFMMKVKLRQMEKKYEYHIVTENDPISLTGIEFQYDDFLSHFNVYWRSNQNSDWEYVRSISIYDTSEYSEKMAQYEIDTNTKTIILNFISDTSDLIPFNSEFRIDIFTTKGSVGNITYNGDGSDIVVEPISYDGNHIYNGIILQCRPITDAVGGIDAPTIDELRAKVIRAKASKAALSTEYDLFNYMKERDMVDDYYFVKKRYDIMDHIYSTYMAPRLLDGSIIPSSTLDLIVSSPINVSINEDNKISAEIKSNGDSIALSQNLRINMNNTTDVNSITIPTGTVFVHNNEGKFKVSAAEYVLNTDNEYKPTNLNLKEAKVYANPYTIVYNIKDNLSSVYLTSIDRNVDVSLLDMRSDEMSIDLDTGKVIDNNYEMSTNFVIDHIHITRNSFTGDNKYHITVSVMPNGDCSNCGNKDDEMNVGIYENALMLKGFIYSENIIDTLSNAEYPSSMFDFKFTSYSNGVFTFDADIVVDDSLIVNNNSSKLVTSSAYGLINDTMKFPEEGAEGETIKNLLPSDALSLDASDLKIGIGTYYISQEPEEGDELKPSIVFNSEEEGTSKTIQQDEAYRGYPSFRKGEFDYILTNVYINGSDLIDLYTDMSYIMRINTYISSDSNTIIFEDIPLIQYTKLIDSNYANRLNTILNNAKGYLDEMNMRLDDSFTLDYKFYRTYGPCQYFKLKTLKNTDTDIEHAINLPYLDISMNLNVVPNEASSATDAEIISNIKDFLKSYMEKINNEDDDYTIFLSNVTREIENNFSNIVKSADVVDISGQDSRYRILYYDKPNFKSYTESNRLEVAEFVPEYLNLPLENITINVIRNKKNL